MNPDDKAKVETDTNNAELKDAELNAVSGGAGYLNGAPPPPPWSPESVAVSIYTAATNNGPPPGYTLWGSSPIVNFGNINVSKRDQTG
jgi:hypothetical protein